MKVLVTGGAGFIGSAIAASLIERGADVVVLDDLSSGELTSIPRAAEFIEQDISEDAIPALVAAVRPTHIVHAAAQVRVSESMADPVRDRRVNLDGTRHVLAGATRADVRRFVFVSSGGAIYGEAQAATEDRRPSPRSYYGIHKLAAEGYVAISGLPFSIARPSNVYGEGQRPELEGGVVAVFADAVQRGARVEIHGDGEQVRDFIHVTDVVSALMRMIDSDRDGTWNVATSVATSINELLCRLERQTGVHVERRAAPARAGDVRVSSLAVDLIDRELDWAPSITLEDGLARLVRVASDS